MIDVQRITEHDSLGAGKRETRRHVTMSRESCERLTAGKHTPERCEAAFKFFARPGGKGINPPTLRRDGDLALFPGDATLPVTVLKQKRGTWRPQGQPARGLAVRTQWVCCCKV